MIVNPEDRRREAITDNKPSLGTVPSFTDSIASGFESMQAADLIVSERRNKFDVYEQITSELRKKGVDIENPLVSAEARVRRWLGDPLGLRQKITGIGTEESLESSAPIPTALPGTGLAARAASGNLGENPIKNFWETVEKNRNKLPDDSMIKNANEENLEEIARKKGKKTVLEEQLKSRQEGLAGGVSRFAGNTAAFATDPIMPLSALLTGATLPAGMSWGTRILAEAGVETLVEAGAQPIIQQERSEMDLPSGPGRAAANIAFAPAATVALGGAFKGAVDTTRFANEKFSEFMGDTKKVREFWKENVPDAEKTTEQMNANHFLETGQRILERNPHDKVDGGINAGESQHVARTREAIEDIQEGNPVQISERDTDIPKKGLELNTRNLSKYSYETKVDPENIADRTEELEIRTGETDEAKIPRTATDEYNESSSPLMLFEDEEGQLKVVDGQKQLNFARKLNREGQNIQPDARVFRAEDGWRPEQMKRVSAIRNLHQGNLEPKQAAKFFRGNTDVLDEIAGQNKVDKAVERLTKMPEPVFRKVIKNDVRADYASSVTRWSDELSEEEQIKVIENLRRSDPDNQNQADMIVDQEAQRFGGDVDSVSEAELNQRSQLSGERAKILDRFEQEISQDDDLFDLIFKRKEDVLQQSVKNNKDEALALVRKMANGGGNLTNELTEVARSFRESGDLQKHVDEFAERIDQSIARGDLSGESVGEAGRYYQVREKVERQLFSGRARAETREIIRRSDNPEEGNSQLEQRLKTQIDRAEEGEASGRFSEAIEKWKSLENAESFRDLEIMVDEDGTKMRFEEILDDLEEDDKFVREVEDCIT